MALPNRARSARLSNATIGDQIDDQIGLLETAFCDILGIPINTDISNALFAAVAGGLTKVLLQDLALDAAVAGQISRNGAALQFHDGTAVRALVKSNLQVLGGNGLTGGGALTGDVTLHLDAPISVTVITASGSWSKPAGLVYARIIAIGGGGGGGGVDLAANTTAAGGGGGAGSYSESLIAAATLGATETVTIGAGGVGGVTGGPSGQDGLVGVDTSFGAHVIAKGGSPGLGTTTANDVGEGGSGGVGSSGTGQIEVDGNDGGHGGIDAQWAAGGFGAGPVFGANKKSPLLKSSGATAGNAGKNYGGGGSGAVAFTNSTSVAGGTGAAGVIIVVAY